MGGKELKVINKTLLATFRVAGKCEACGKWCNERDPHHVFSKGAGRVDARLNLIALCRLCHNGFHASGKPSRAELLVIVGKREGKTPEDIEDFVYRVRRDSRCKIWIVDEKTNKEPD